MVHSGVSKIGQFRRCGTDELTEYFVAFPAARLRMNRQEEDDMRTSRLGLIAGIALVSVPLVAGTSFACADHEYEQCVLGACVCLPKIGGAVGQGAQHLKEELQGQIGGPVYEQAIVQSRNTAINGAMPIPPQIRQALTGYASAEFDEQSQIQNSRQWGTESRTADVSAQYGAPNCHYAYQRHRISRSNRGE